MTSVWYTYRMCPSPYGLSTPECEWILSQSDQGIPSGCTPPSRQINTLTSLPFSELFMVVYLYDKIAIKESIG